MQPKGCSSRSLRCVSGRHRAERLRVIDRIVRLNRHVQQSGLRIHAHLFAGGHLIGVQQSDLRAVRLLYVLADDAAARIACVDHQRVTIEAACRIAQRAGLQGLGELRDIQVNGAFGVHPLGTDMYAIAVTS
jgi:hypothetical protein